MCRSLSRIRNLSRAIVFLPGCQSVACRADKRSIIRRNDARSAECASLFRPTTLLHRHEDAVPDLALDCLRQMALAGRVLDQDHLAGADNSRLAVARGDLHAGVEIDDVLPARRRVPVQIIVRLHLAEDDAGRRQPLRQFAGPAFLGPFDLDVAEMRLALGVGVEIVDAHGAPPAGSPLLRDRSEGDCSGSAGSYASAATLRLVS